MRRWELGVLKAVRARLDASALGGRNIAQAGLNRIVFDANPATHRTQSPKDAVGPALQTRHDALVSAARTDERLPPGTSLIAKWTLTYDIYSPRLRRFIEVDERQHFSRVRLERIQQTRPRYPQHFWHAALGPLLRSPSVDRDPPHRDEARAYRDEARELLPVAYGLNPTIRLDEFSLAQEGVDVISLIEALL